MTIGKVAQAAGVGVETIRFYERKGLLPEPPRRESGYRQYGLDAVQRVRFVQRAKELGFSLKEVRELLELEMKRGVTCGAVRKRAMRKIEDIDAKLACLRRMRTALRRLVAECGGQGPIRECPILEALEEDKGQ